MGTNIEIRIRIGLSAEILLSKINDCPDIVGKGIFKDSLDCFITFDNSSGDCFIEAFPSLQSAYKYLAHNKFCECSLDDTSGCIELFEEGRSICNNCGLFVKPSSEVFSRRIFLNQGVKNE